jgi:hypothetical protein
MYAWVVIDRGNGEFHSLELHVDQIEVCFGPAMPRFRLEGEVARDWERAAPMHRNADVATKEIDTDARKLTTDQPEVIVAELIDE